ncbi:MAG: aldo/keto reductase [Rhizobiales bacterium]|nr:aldo/keto reductase [Hyphomicrobiales bacterium]
MNYVRLGKTGLKVSKLCLGCMSYGTPGWDVHPWVLDEAASIPFIHDALARGINFFDTADFYSRGASEVILGKALMGVPRDEVVVASKVCLAMGEKPNQKGLSRKHIMEGVDRSLERLGMDYMDLLIIHRLDHDTPMEETCDALNDVVRSGRALYIGASSMFAWQFMKMLGIQRANGFAEFVSMQNFYNLVYREEEREMMPLCLSEQIGVTPWSPMARGFLTKGIDESATSRAGTDRLALGYFGTDADHAVLAAVRGVAADLKVKPAQVALAWVLSKAHVCAPIVGATRPHHLSDAIAALDIVLEAEMIEALEAPYQTRAVQGHS